MVMAMLMMTTMMSRGRCGSHGADGYDDGDGDYVDVVDDHRDDGEDYGYDHDSDDGNQ